MSRLAGVLPNVSPVDLASMATNVRDLLESSGVSRTDLVPTVRSMGVSVASLGLERRLAAFEHRLQYGLKLSNVVKLVLLYLESGM